MQFAFCMLYEIASQHAKAAKGKGCRRGEGKTIGKL